MQVGAFRGEVHRRPAAQHAGARLADGPALRAPGGHGEDGGAGAHRGAAQDPRGGAELPRRAECRLKRGRMVGFLVCVYAFYAIIYIYTYVLDWFKCVCDHDDVHSQIIQVFFHVAM